MARRIVEGLVAATTIGAFFIAVLAWLFPDPLATQFWSWPTLPTLLGVGLCLLMAGGLWMVLGRTPHHPKRRWAFIILYVISSFGFVWVGLQRGTSSISPSSNIAIISLSYQVNRGNSRVIDLRTASTRGIAVKPGNTLKIIDIWYSSQTDVDATVNAEIYTSNKPIGACNNTHLQLGINRMGDCQPGAYVNGSDPNSWVVQENWNMIDIVPVLYYEGKAILLQRIPLKLSKDGSLGLIEVTSLDAAITIVSPDTGDQIPRVIDVRGVASNVSNDKKVWLYLHTFYDRYFLTPITPFPDGTWIVKDFAVGDAQEHGTRFELGILLADRDADTHLQNKAYDLEYLPYGVELMPPIIITRK